MIRAAVLRMALRVIVAAVMMIKVGPAGPHGHVGLNSLASAAHLASLTELRPICVVKISSPTSRGKRTLVDVPWRLELR